MSKKLSEVFYLNDKQIPKQTYNKYLKWIKVLKSILRETDKFYMLKEIYGYTVHENLTKMKRAGYIDVIGKSTQGYYVVTERGRQLIDELENNIKKGEVLR